MGSNPLAPTKQIEAGHLPGFLRLDGFRIGQQVGECLQSFYPFESSEGQAVYSIRCLLGSAATILYIYC